MILSVSRRTDIPNYYSEWFYNRIRDGYFYVRNPMNARQISKVPLSPEVVDCIVFWTKNPEPMLSRLEELEAYPYYFQFTLTSYGKDIERNVPQKRECMIPIFQRLAEKIGRERVIWRYDPILFTDKYTPEYHLTAFEQIAGELKGYTSKCVISFVDLYAKNRKNLNAINSRSLPEKELTAFAAQLASIAKKQDIRAASCAEAIDLSACGIEHNCCIDREWIERIIGCKIRADKDKNQRAECGCVESVDVGVYNTCKNGCVYCYANYSPESVLQSSRSYDVNSPLLCGTVTEADKITERAVQSLKEPQLSLWDE
ncbi:MAG: DUF1848 domain-containing protein [Roseburia sp.]|nr:DUF1848 domain-containing protein [Roseburia sp.]MCM1098534.1 DUF1848 domain-containing protein [Ruminococcus flavefaciens]